jgi:hypothetical protein
MDPLVLCRDGVGNSVYSWSPASGLVAEIFCPFSGNPVFTGGSRFIITG